MSLLAPSNPPVPSPAEVNSARKGETNPLEEREAAMSIVFTDFVFLSQNSLNHPTTAMEYFYRSPFYEANSLNDLMLKGQKVDEFQNGILFEVTHHNTAVIAPVAPTQWDLRHMYFNQHSIFVIKKFERKAGHKFPIKAFYILCGALYPVPSFSAVLRYRMALAVEHFDQCLETVQAMSRWSLTGGYRWHAPLTDEKRAELKRLALQLEGEDSSAYDVSSSYPTKGEIRQRKRKSEMQDWHAYFKEVAKEGYMRERLSTPDESSKNLNGDVDEGMARVVYHKPICDLALRVYADEMKVCMAEKARIQAERNQIESQLREISQQAHDPSAVQ